MKKGARASTVLTLRVPQSLNRKLTQEARRQRRTRGETARALLAAALEDVKQEDPAIEARRQSRLASAQASERDTQAFIAGIADLRGWE
jgi:hypothetical protein